MLFVYWPDGTYCPADDFDYEADYSWKSDDFCVVSLEQLAVLLGISEAEIMEDYT